MQNLGEQRQRDDSSHDEESSPYRLRQAPKGVQDDSQGRARGGLSVDGRGGWARSRLAGSCEKGVWIARRQKFACTLTDLGADEDELGVQLPVLDLHIRGRLRLGENAFLKGRPLIGDNAKPVLEIECGFEGDSGHTVTRYRRQASLT